MPGLWRKELRSILPFLSLAVILPAFGILFELWSGLPSAKPWAATQFVYPSNMSGRVLPLVAVADRVHEKVRQLLGAEEGEPIVVDATTALPRHAGFAYWDKIRLDLAAEEDLPALESTLGHETAHVFLERLSDSRLSDRLNSTRFFHEGVATYVEYRLFHPARGIEDLRRVAAVMRDRDEVRFEELVDHSLLASRRDGDLVYPLGEVFVAELVARHGDAAIGKIARALARNDAPERLSGEELWHDLFQACGYSLDGALGAFFARVDEEVARQRTFIDRLPRLRGAVGTAGSFVDVRTVGKASLDDWQPICRFRQKEDSPERLYVDGVSVEPGVFVAWRGEFPGATLWFQLGLRNEKGTAIFEPWTQVPLND